MYMYRLAKAEMPTEQRLASDSEFKPNLVNSVCYIVEAIVQVCCLATWSLGARLHASDSDFKPNLVNSMCYIVDAIVLVC